MHLNDPDCSALRQSAPRREVVPEVLTVNVPLNDATHQGEYKVYEISINHAHSSDNMLIEVKRTCPLDKKQRQMFDGYSAPFFRFFVFESLT